jgi:hypothetical protein
LADTFARMRGIIGTTADWAANNIVLLNGELGAEFVSGTETRLKVGNGTATWSALPYASGPTNTINAATQTALDAKLALAGGTMTGLLVLSGDAVADLGAVTKQQLDNVEDTLTTSIAGKLNASGGTLTGFLTANADPTSALHVATKQYVDTADGTKVAKAGDTLTGFLTLHADPTSAMHSVTKQYVDGPSGYQTVVGGSSAYAGKVVRTNAAGFVDSSLLPITGSYQGAVDVTDTYALPGGYNIGDYFAVSISGTIDASWNTYITGSPTTAASGQFLIYNAAGDFDLVGDDASSTAIDGKLDKTGGTMTGFITLHADPTSALHAAPKQYVDARVAKAGDTVTGFITLHADPTSALHAAPKQYVDARVLKAGDTMTGFITLHADPSSNLHAATKQYVDARVAKAGDTMTGALTLHADPSSNLHAATKQYVDGKIAGKISVGTTAPSSPATNDLWVDTN